MESTTQKTVEEFVKTARAFCDWAENPPDDQDEDFRKALRLLPQLYFAAISLRESGGDETEVKDLPKCQFDFVFNRFSKLPFDAYSEHLNPLVVPTEKAGGSLTMDLHTIYWGVKTGVLHFDAGFTEQAVWHWQFHFRAEWGRHLLDALRALHCYAEEHFLWPHIYLNEHK
jgi:hypothetical protein